MLGPGVPQLHDYNPGITANGVFWTVRIPDRAVRVDRRTGIATYALSDTRLDDYYNLANAFAGGPSTPAHATFRTTFVPTGKTYTVRDEANRFAVRYRDATARLEWTAQGGGFAFRSDALSTSTDTFAMTGIERNGKFFR